MDKVTPKEITVALTIDQVDAHNGNYNALSDKDIEIFDALNEKIDNQLYSDKAVIVASEDLTSIYINPLKIIATAFRTKEEAIGCIEGHKFTFVPADSVSPTHVAITASYIENGEVTFFLYTAPFNMTTLYYDKYYSIEYNETESKWAISE